MALSRKEIISVLLLITAILCVLNASVFANIVPLHYSYEQVAHQAVSVGTAYICLIYSLSTWLYHSNYYRARQDMRLVLAIMISVMMVCNGVSIYFFMGRLSFDKLKKSTDVKYLLSSFALASVRISLALTIVCILLMFVALLIIIWKFSTARKRRAQAWKESNEE